jgi:HSP20 family protein
MTTSESKQAVQKVDEAYQGPVYRPATDIYSNDQEFVLTLDMPGVSDKDLEVKVEDQHLSVFATATTPVADDSYEVLHSEWAPGRYERTFHLPQDIDRDAITAQLKHGVLRLVLPKAHVSRARTIEIK